MSYLTCFVGVLLLPVMAMLQLSGIVNWLGHIEQAVNVVYIILCSI